MGSAKRKSSKKRRPRASKAKPAKSTKKTASPAPTEAPIFEMRISLPTSFHKFNLLPSELRVQIWKLSLPDPRIVHLELSPFRPFQAPLTLTNEDIECHLHSPLDPSFLQPGIEQIGSNNEPVEDELYCKARASQPAPTLLVVCKESHNVAAIYYEQTFATVGQEASVWFSSELDTVYLSADVLRKLIFLGLGDEGLGVNLGKFRKVLLDDRGLKRHLAVSPNYDCVCDIIGWFGKLKQLTFVHQGESAVPSNGDLTLAGLVSFPFDQHLEYYEARFDLQRDWQMVDWVAGWPVREQNLRVHTVAKLEQSRSFKEDLAKAQGLQPLIWDRPYIDRKTLNTKKKKAAYDTAFARYMKDRNNYKESLVARVTISLPGDIREYWYQFIATHAKTMKDVVEELRAERNLPQERRFASSDSSQRKAWRK